MSPIWMSSQVTIAIMLIPSVGMAFVAIPISVHVDFDFGIVHNRACRVCRDTVFDEWGREDSVCAGCVELDVGVEPFDFASFAVAESHLELDGGGECATIKDAGGDKAVAAMESEGGGGRFVYCKCDVLWICHKKNTQNSIKSVLGFALDALLGISTVK